MHETCQGWVPEMKEKPSSLELVTCTVYLKKDETCLVVKSIGEHVKFLLLVY